MSNSIERRRKVADILIGVFVAAGSAAVILGLAALISRAPAPAEAGEDTSAAQVVQRSVNVNATDSVKVQPDRAELSLSIRPQADTADAAREAAAGELSQLTAALGGLGIDAQSVASSQVSINPVYDWSDSTQKITGYEADVTVTVKDLSLEQASSALTAAAAVSDTSVNGLSYYVSTYDEQYQSALVSAMQAARQKAEVLAGAAGASVGQALSVQEGTDSQEYRYEKAVADSAAGVMAASNEAAAEMTSEDIALNPGEVEISASVTVTYELQ